MSILNYFFIGAGFTFLIDLLLGMDFMRKHPTVSDALEKDGWGLKQRIMLVLIWPLGAIVFITFFIVAYIRQFFK